MGICHRDLKLENFIFTTHDPDREIKLIDFGYSKAYLQDRHMHEIVGTSYYIAPEVLNADYTAKSDLWSLGVLVFMMLSGRVPFPGQSDEDIQNRVKIGQFTFKNNRWKDVSTQAKDFICRLLVMNPDERFGAEQALKHPWIVGSELADSDAAKLPEHDEPVDQHLVQHLKHYRSFNRLKKAALMAIAFGMSENEIDGLKQAFVAFDTQQNGTVSLAEFRQVMMRTGQLSENEIETLFADLDLDGSGLIKYSEFLAAAVSESICMQEDKIVEAFNRLDTDHSGFISKQNLREILGNEFDDAALDRLIADADFLKDGKINLDEFRRLMHGEKAQ